jgi:3-dehydroquinate synthetase
LGFLSPLENKSLNKIIDKLTLPNVSKVDPNTILSFVKKDKKVRNGILHFVVLDALGKGNTSELVSETLIMNSLKVIR